MEKGLCSQDPIARASIFSRAGSELHRLVSRCCAHEAAPRADFGSYAVNAKIVCQCDCNRNTISFKPSSSDSSGDSFFLKNMKTAQQPDQSFDPSDYNDSEHRSALFEVGGPFLRLMLPRTLKLYIIVYTQPILTRFNSWNVLNHVCFAFSESNRFLIVMLIHWNILLCGFSRYFDDKPSSADSTSPFFNYKLTWSCKS